jgi:hypothetical protein
MAVNGETDPKETITSGSYVAPETAYSWLLRGSECQAGELPNK